MVACPFPAVAVGADGFEGAVGAGTTALEGLEAGEAPLAFRAATVKVYDVPFLRPCTVQPRGPELHVHVWFPVLDVTA